MDASENLPVFHALLEEEYLLNQTLATPEARRRLRLMLELGGQRRENELDMPALLAAIGRAEAEYTDKDLTVGGQ